MAMDAVAFVLMTSPEKARLAKAAQIAGVSQSQFVRDAVSVRASRTLERAARESNAAHLASVGAAIFGGRNG